jgi:Uma2 family endonuclease
MAAGLKLPEFLTVDAFLAWDAPSGQMWQLVDGVPQAMAPANTTHGLIQNEVGRLLGNHLLARGNRCTVLTAPGVVPRVQSDINMRVPDLGVTCSPPRPGEAAMRDPILLIEILSPSNQPETWTNVWSYTTIPSVREILVLGTTAVGADLLRRNPDGTWPDRPLVIDQGNIALEGIDYTAPIASFYRTTWLGEAAATAS